MAAALEDLGDQGVVVSLVSSMLTAGLTTGALDMAGIPEFSDQMSFGDKLITGAQRNLIQQSIRMGVAVTVEGQPLGEAAVKAVRMAAADTLGGALASEIGDLGIEHGLDDGSFGKIVMHAVAGCAVGAIGSDSCIAGGIGAGISEALGRPLAELTDDPGQQTRIAALIGGVAGALAGVDAQAVSAAANAATTVHSYNYLSHEQIRAQIDEMAACAGDQACIANVEREYAQIDQAQELALTECRTTACVDEHLERIVAAEATLVADLAELGQYSPSAANRTWAQQAESSIVKPAPSRTNAQLYRSAAAYCESNPGPDCFTQGALLAATAEGASMAAYEALGIAALGAARPGALADEAAGVPNRTLTPIDSPVDLTNGRSGHILANHRAGAGKPGKTEFPSDWSDSRIIHQVSDISTDPTLTRQVDNRGTPYVSGTREGVDITVTFFPDSHPRAGQISSAYPTNVPANPRQQ